MSSEGDGTDRAARAERCLHQLCRVVREVDRKVNHGAEHYILEGVTDALFLDLYEQQIKDFKVFGYYALEIPFFIAYQDLSERWNWDRKTVMIFLKSLQKMGVIEIKREYRRVTVHILNLAIAPPNTNSEINEDTT